MNFRQPRERDVDVNLTPLIDVVFLLLIFFMVSTTFVKESKIDLTLPQASEDVREDDFARIEVAVDREGEVFVDEKALVNTQVETIRQALAAARPEGEAQPVVIISADAAAAYQRVVDVMDAARQAGLNRITFPTRARAEDR
ncbi:MAG: biopolymer transporter ExbD [Gammaproteobacteria bacterium]|nr:biopolymer transporter ExbD [Gammaproteobacteria bacterium]MCP5202456.1 biopolymer transporter ExbD [Gammaproteobacteria bacterium]